MAKKTTKPGKPGIARAPKKKAPPAKKAPAARKPRTARLPADSPSPYPVSDSKPRDLVEALLAHADDEERNAGTGDVQSPGPGSERRMALPAVFGDRAEDTQADGLGDFAKPLMSQLDRFRGRLLKILITILVFTIASLFLSDYLLDTITRPFIASGQKLNVFTLTGGIMIRIKAAFGAGILMAIPVLVFQVWRFLMPILTKTSRRYTRFAMLAAVILFYSGVAFVYFLLLPVAVTIMLGFVGPNMVTTIGAEDYLSFVLIFCLSMGVLFEFPIIVLVLTKLGIITPQFLSSKRKYAIVIIWVIAAIITPTPDPINQTFVAVPLMVFYEISIVLSRLVSRKKQIAAE